MIHENMKDFMCSNCVENFRHSVIDNNCEHVRYPNFQMLCCPKCNSILYWAESMKTNIVKSFDDFTRIKQHQILIGMCNE